MTAGQWEDSACPICPPGTESRENLRCSDRLREPGLENYRLRICSQCGLKYLSPRPVADSASEFYLTEGYDPFISVKGAAGIPDRAFSFARRLMLRWKRNLVARYIPHGGSILDIGCGTGEFLDALADDYTTIGVEPDPEAARWASDRLGLRVYIGDRHALPMEVTELDLITMWHVLEHVPDPAAALSDIYDRLKPRGKLLLALPNINSLDARLYKSTWVAVDAPRHLWHFSPRQVEKIAEQSSFNVMKSGMLPLDTFYNILLSEKLNLSIHGWKSLLIAPPRIVFTTVASLAWGILTGQHSGMYYLLDKK